MIRMRSKGSSLRLKNNSGRMRERDSPPPPAGLDLVDEDDDLRSLLSGDSSSEVANPHRHHHHLQQQQQQGGGHGIVKPLPPLSEGDGTSASARAITRSNSCSASSMDSNTNSNNKSSNQKSKKVLWMIGTVILALVLVGPSGLLWGGTQTEAKGIIHGDKHHHLAPPPPHHYEAMNSMENIDSPDAMHWSSRQATATQGRHNRYGERQEWQKEKVRRNRKKKNKNKKEDGGGWNIKEAIENLDKIFLEHKPLTAVEVHEEDADSRQDDEFLTDDALTAERETNVLPVIHDADSDAAAQARLDANVDALDAYTNTQLPASDALECRASVVAFVINATDVRDECDGLRRAFDKTCSVAHGGGGPPVSAAAAQRRRLSERGRPRLWNLIPEAYLRESFGVGRKKVSADMSLRWRSLLRMVSRKSGGISESKIDAGTTRTGSKRSLQEMRNDPAESRDHNSHQHPTRRHIMNEERKMEEEGEEEVVLPVAEEQLPQQQQKPIEQQQPMISLNIPTADKHITQEMLNDALLLQQSESDSKPITVAPVTSVDTNLEQRGEEAPDNAVDGEASQAVHQHDPSQPSLDPPKAAAVPNQNITAESAKAVQDAAESASAIRTAVETVKNSMNDAKSIEARTCCASILSVFHEHCDPTTTGVEDFSDRRLLIVVLVITVCGIVKSLIRHLNIRWLPEAGGCILVGVFGHLILEHLPHVKFAFDGDMFLRIMVPPIVFEAAVKINKSSFRKHIVPICIFAIVGTLASTAFTALILHKGTSLLGRVVTIPLRESFIFGALISSIDPIAVLSILNSMGMTDSDSIYCLIFGESLLNDGVAIVLFQTLVHFLDESLVIDADVIMDAFMHFVVVALGSVTVGCVAGACATVYFSLMRGCQTPMVEVMSFCCWSFIPYYICDMVEWSGIVAIVANGFVMDLFVIGQPHGTHGIGVDEDIDFLVNGGSRGNNNRRGHHRNRPCWGIFNYEGYLSSKANSHVHFVIEIFATLMETAIFAYLGLFLFSDRYHWRLQLTLISIFATVMGRVLMIPLLSQISNIFNQSKLSRHRRYSNASSLPSDRNIDTFIDCRMQTVLVFAGLRGAMSFALVEHIPMFDTTTGQGSRLKPELKSMTSASVIFTTFVLGGATSYLMERLNYSPSKQQIYQDDELEITELEQQEKRRSPHLQQNSFSMETGTRYSSVRQRGSATGR